MPDGERARKRITSIDGLRGTAMVLMTLDHVRDFFHREAMEFSPTDLAHTNPPVFFTRWVTHFCLPVFMLTAGMGTQLQRVRQSPAEVSRFLATRGLWFILLELTVMQFAYNFSLDSGATVLLLVLWIFGICMLAMAGLVRLPLPLLLSFGAVAMLFPAVPGKSVLWSIWHQPGLLNIGGRSVLLTYTLAPWLGVFCAGYGLARIYERETRVRTLGGWGAGMLAAFLVLRFFNLGDPVPWAPQPSGVGSLMSFLNCAKYPASPDFLLMTLGPALLLLALLERTPWAAGNPLVVLGRVPLFYFVLHFYAIHALAVLFAFLRYGVWLGHAWPTMGGPANLFPSDLGYSLATVYAVWLLTLVTLYPACAWFARFKARRRDWWLSYL